ncbi:MAG: type II toxin-antitoxin system PemK/MazF family toxin [Acidobacteriia bacterium]|nr:type II toxin-antitoxin system PemK/MazF family toxin [Terriglobia bacterium]
MAVVSRPPAFDEVWLVVLDPALGSEIQKTRPCLVISPDEMNRHLRTVIIAPLTSAERPYPIRVPIMFQNKRGQIALDQIRAVDRQRLIRRLGTVSSKTGQAVSRCLVELFTRVPSH